MNEPTDQQRQLARAVLNPLTDVQRQAVVAVVALEVSEELGESSVEFTQAEIAALLGALKDVPTTYTDLGIAKEKLEARDGSEA